MQEKIIKKDKINKFLEETRKEYKIFAPVEKDSDFRFNEINEIKKFNEINENYRNTKISPKEIFFPQTEVLYEFHGEEVKQPNNHNLLSNTLLFGVRPCDAQALTFLDKVFIERTTNYELRTTNEIDPYYLNKRERTTIISLACTKPQITCFCTSVKGKPDNEEGSDIILFDLDEDILVKPLTANGKKFIENFNKWFKEAKKSDIEKKDKLMNLSLEKIRSQVNVQNIKEKLDKSFDVSFWNEIHQKCLGCGICTYLCPTCHCFDITDEVQNKQGKRMRCWDSCMFPLFTLHASGHQPRPTYKERMRQRIMHKFNYCPENFNEIFCVGCGRCVRNCPVNLDIREIIENVELRIENEK